MLRKRLLTCTSNSSNMSSRSSNHRPPSHQAHEVGDVLTWWAFTSATTTADVLQAEAFMGFGKAGYVNSTTTPLYSYRCAQSPCFIAATLSPQTKAAKAKAKQNKKTNAGRTVFHIKALYGISISIYSAIPNEDEVLLLPGSRFMIDDHRVGLRCGGGPNAPTPTTASSHPHRPHIHIRHLRYSCHCR
jgi:hypothetical protein